MKGNNILILSGLPGSGKTTFADTMALEDDTVFVYHQDEKENEWWLYDQWYHNTIIVDALNLTNDAIIASIKDVQKHIYKREWNYTIVRWKEDRKTCLYNDKGRRSVAADKTIQHAKFEMPDLKRIKSETGIKNLRLEEKEVVPKSEYWSKINTKKYIIKGHYLLSDEWLVSGTQREYNSDYTGSVYSSMDGEDTPEFNELYDFIEEICPNISFFDFRKIQKECVEVITYDEHDYYSDTTNSYYRCDLDKLFIILGNKYETPKSQFVKESEPHFQMYVSFENTFIEDYGRTIQTDDDSLARIYIDGYPLDQAKDGTVIATVTLSKSRDIIVDWHYNAYRLNTDVKELINESIKYLKDYDNWQ